MSAEPLPADRLERLLADNFDRSKVVAHSAVRIEAGPFRHGVWVVHDTDRGRKLDLIMAMDGTKNFASKVVCEEEGPVLDFPASLWVLVHAPQNRLQLLAHLANQPRVFVSHPIPEECGERTFVRASPRGLYFRKADGSEGMVPLPTGKGSPCPPGMKVVWDDLGVQVVMGNSKVSYVYLGEKPWCGYTGRVTNHDEAAAYLTRMLEIIGGGFHPDNKVAGYSCYGQDCFTPEQAERHEQLLGAAWQHLSGDIYQFCTDWMEHNPTK